MRAADAEGDQPTCFIAYTIKGMGLPFAGHKDNHAGLMTKEQMELFRARDGHPPRPRMGSVRGAGRCAGGAARLLAACPFATPLTPEGRALTRAADFRAGALPMPKTGRPQDVHAGRLRRHPGRDRPRPGRLKELAAHIVTTSPDVTVSTNLGPWVNRRGIFDRHTRNDVFRDAKLASAQRWGMCRRASTSSLGIAEQNLFLLLGAAGLTRR